MAYGGRDGIQSDEEFELCITLAAHWNWHHHADDEDYEEVVMSDVVRHRFLWYHGRHLRALREKHLPPLVERLVEEARHGPMFDGAFLYQIELEKLRCMRTYFSLFFHCRQERGLQFQAVDGHLHPLVGIHCGRRQEHL